ncbi:MAG: exo-alpha-sialidase, partial [Prevotella sp.]|nr:exo-alpha-sialidase [Prevotella sp.]
LVRLVDAGDGKFYIQTGLGNFFGAFDHKQNVPVTATEEEKLVVEKIANTDGHFYVQSTTTSVVLNANDVGSGDATVVGWNKDVPTAIDGNNDFAFYPVTLTEIDESVALFESNVSVTRGYQTCGRGNENSLMLRIDVEPMQNISDATFTVKLNVAAKNNISSLYIYETTATEFIANIPSAPLGSTSEIGTTASINIGNVSAKKHYFWLCATVKEDAELEKILEAALSEISYTCKEKSQSLNVASVGKPSRQGMKVFDQQNFVFKPTSDNCRYYRIPAMVLDQNGNLVVAIDKRYNSNSDLGNHKIDVITMRSEDNGRTWTNKADVAIGDAYTAAYVGFGDPALARAENGDLVCLMASGSKTWGYGMITAGFAKSTNNGKSWKLTKNLFESSKFYDENSSNGKLSVNNLFTSSGKGLVTNDGVIMFTTNCCESRSSTYYIYVIYSTDNGETWRLSKSVAYSGGDESKLEQMNDGSLLLSVRQNGNRGWNTATYSKNADGTVDFKWGTQKRTGDIWGNACNADILYYSRKTDGKEDIMLHSYINTGGRESLQLAMSLDGGKSWKSVYNIQPNGSCYSTMIQLPNGNVALLY